MKAKVIKTGEVVEVSLMTAAMYCDTSTSGIDENVYYKSKLDLLPDTHEEVTIEGWVARDEGGSINIFDSVPRRKVGDFWMNQGCYYLMRDLQYENPNIFPSVTWESEPKRVKITITPMEE